MKFSRSNCTITINKFFLEIRQVIVFIHFTQRNRS